MTRRLAALLALLPALALAAPAGAQEEWMAKPAPTCSDGAVSAKCKCGGAKVTSGYCCSGVAQPGMCPIIAEDANTVAHLFVRNAALVDSKGNAWSVNGSLTYNAATATAPESVSGFSDSNWIQLGTGVDVLDFTGAYYCTFVLRNSANANQVIFSDFNGTTLGYYIQSSNGSAQVRGFNASTSSAVVETSPTLGSLYVLSWGYSGTQYILQANTTTQAPVTAAAPGAASSSPVRIGRYENTGIAASSTTLYEVMCTTSAAAQATFTTIATVALAKAS